MLSRKQIGDDLYRVTHYQLTHHSQRETLKTALKLAEWLEFYKRESYLRWIGSRAELKEQLQIRDASDAWLQGEGGE